MTVSWGFIFPCAIDMLGYMHKVYYKTQGINLFKSWLSVVRWAYTVRRSIGMLDSCIILLRWFCGN